MKRFIREPLVHFIVIGLILFAGHSIWQGRKASEAQTIRVSIAEIEHLSAIWASEMGRAPTIEDIQGIVADHVHEETLYREALRLGLDQGDTVVRRRLAQKMRFMLDDIGGGTEPDETELRAAFDAAPERYALPEKLTFSHVYFSPETHGSSIEEVAASMLAELQENDADWKQAGDPFMLPRSFGDLAKPDIAQLFGAAFSDAIIATENDGWSGPYGSAFGLHLVRIDKRTPGTTPSFETVRDRVRADLAEASRRAANDEALAEVLARYDVVIEGLEP